MSETSNTAKMGKQYVRHPPEVQARMQRLLEFHELTKQHCDHCPDEQRPTFFRVFADAPKLALPTHVLDAPTGVLKVMTMGTAALPDSMTSPPQNLRTIASWLHMAAGITGKATVGAGIHHLRAYASAGAMYPCEIYVALLGIEGAEPGLYHFSAKEFALRRLRSGAETVSLIKRGRPDLDVLKTMPAIIFVSTIYWRSAWRYGLRAFRYAAIDAGHVTENIVQAGHGLGLQTMVRLHMNDRNTRELIGSPRESSFDCYEVVQSMVAWADTATNPLSLPPVRSAAPALAPIPRQSVSPAFTDLPRICTAHDDCVAPGVGVHEIRPPYTEMCPLGEGSELHALGNEEIYSDMGVMAAMKKRRSIREFDPHGISRDHFAKLARVAFGGGTYYPMMPNGSHMGLVRAYWYVQNVTGLTPGIWYYHANYDKFTPVRYGDFRFECKYLLNDQEFCGHASTICVMVADLQQQMNCSSPDAYRLAHLEAGIAGQRLYLACTAMNVECCSVGSFRDEELRRSLDLTSTSWQCLYAFAIGGLRRQATGPVPDESAAGSDGQGMKLK